MAAVTMTTMMMMITRSRLVHVVIGRACAASSASSASGVAPSAFTRQAAGAGVGAPGAGVCARGLTKRAPSSRERSPYVLPRGQKSTAPSALDLKREMEENEAAAAAARELEEGQRLDADKKQTSGQVSAFDVRPRRHDVRAFYLELVKRCAAH